ncbi:hypothetical protein H112_07386 [Trichophyton rubrum D6]|nr:hypothetical protein H102_07375 [Trichophyton rubrum CBS 100081]EZF49024.1 hypothetical protein H103_07397 [Trichophyton rubrum CBS 288.86]EZF59727.1 hypothetical protein H104_07348 [Trichophyton rubrum CBS 289.86]EZF81014.1 hypothetical protein H110_07395 [Trichophyton rubrum MR1448]EZG02882.1 hypothetical protein H106_07235 [Trichophyton rubrum CBS 735.88]KDB30178.1 hypothetical protein H112_07386 [Trichophyton rubrum D6]KMQ42371.1 P-loop containing nucleoside triphosphate hydrolase [Tri
MIKYAIQIHEARSEATSKSDIGQEAETDTKREMECGIDIMEAGTRSEARSKTQSATESKPDPKDKPESKTESITSDLEDTHIQGELAEHLKLVELGQAKENPSVNPLIEQMKTTPLFSSQIKGVVHSAFPGANTMDSLFPQYGLLGLRLASYTPGSDEEIAGIGGAKKNLVYANINAPWSTFICGSQGSGKSHTLSCMLENSLLLPSQTGKVSSQLTSLVLHYDKFTSLDTGQLCEAAYLCSAGIPVRVLVSPSNLRRMTQLYSNLPGLPSGCPRPEVEPMLFNEDHLSIGMMKSLMAISDSEGTPLYMEMVTKILRDMAKESNGQRGIDFQDFETRVREKSTLRGQCTALNMRLDLLRSFLEVRLSKKGKGKPASRKGDIWNFEKGSLTIIDLSCPFVDENDACALFDICIGIFLEGRGKGGRVIALDEAHKYLTTKSREAVTLTETMLSLIRQQRHLATRVIIATQEPTLSPNLLDLCNLTVVHRFSSPAWFNALEGHLAGAIMDVSASRASKYSTGSLFSRIVGLGTGEALVFCPNAILDVSHGDNAELGGDPSTHRAAQSIMAEQGSSYFKMKVRKRITADGGRSILAQ